MSPTLDQLKRAITISEKIESLQAELSAVLGGSAPVAVKAKRGRKPGSKNAKAGGDQFGNGAVEPAKKKKGKRTMSPEAREKIAEAQRKRWAKQKKA